MSQDALMTSDPATGGPKPYPSHAVQWRAYHGTLAWLFNPWTGDPRSAADVGSDPFGLAIVPPGVRLSVAIDWPGGSTMFGGITPAPEALRQAIDASAKRIRERALGKGTLYVTPKKTRKKK